jgi:hypothetical protein
MIRAAGDADRTGSKGDETHHMKRSVDGDFPAAALKAKKLKDIRLELSHIPTPFKEEKLNFAVSIGGQ